MIILAQTSEDLVELSQNIVKMVNHSSLMGGS